MFMISKNGDYCVGSLKEKPTRERVLQLVTRFVGQTDEETIENVRVHSEEEWQSLCQQHSPRHDTDMQKIAIEARRKAALKQGQKVV